MNSNYPEFDDLLVGVVSQAVRDYKQAQKGKWIGKTEPALVMAEVRAFFEHGWIIKYLDVNPEMIMKHLEEGK